MTTGMVLKFNQVFLQREQSQILKNISFQMNFDDHLVIFGPNGAGKSTLAEIAAGFQFPSSGEVEILEQKMGRVDLAQLRLSIGYAGPRLSQMMESGEKVFDAVISAAWGVVGRWQEDYSTYDFQRAEQVLELLGISSFKERAFGSLSAGEKKKVEIARALMNDPELLILDEPAASLDLPAREDLINQLNKLIYSGLSPSILMVTHHLEEVPSGFNKAMLLDKGEILSQGEINEILTAEKLSDLYEMKIKVWHADGRRFAYSVSD